MSIEKTFEYYFFHNKIDNIGWFKIYWNSLCS